MKGFKMRAAVILLSLFSALVSFVVPEEAFAADPTRQRIISNVLVTGGEPGEDPHLRVIPDDPVFRVVYDDGLLLAAAPGDDADGGGDFSRSMRAGGESRHSRGILVWRLMFRMWFCTLQR